jgi:hypothetical protein
MATTAHGIAQSLRSGLKGLAEVTTSTTVQFEGAEYARLYVKPNFKLGSSLLTSREVLVLVAPFRSVQTRAIRLCQKLLDEAKGRLEPGMVAIVHLDASGDERLRVWGRESGLTVLPVDASVRVPQGEALEQALCSSLYTHDPFDLAGPVRASHQFFGRDDVPDVARRLREGHIQAIFGIRKIGKTSVLNRVLDECREYHGMSCAMLDCSDDSLSALDAGQLLNSVAAAINDAIAFAEDHYASVLPLTSEISAPEAGRVLLSILAQSDRPVLLLVDEIDSITPSSPVATHWQQNFNTFFRALRHVYQECARRDYPFSVITTGVSSRWFTVEEISGVENAALAFVPETYLPPFDRSQSIAMVQTLGRSAGLVFSHGAGDLLAETCSDIPFWIRKAGSFINSCFAQSERPIKLRHPDIYGLTKEYVAVEGGKLAYSSLRHLFRIYPELGDVAIGALREVDVANYPQPLVSALGRYGLLSDNFAPSGPMVAAALELWAQDEVSTRRPLPFEASESDQSFADQSSVKTASAVSAGSASPAGELEWVDLLTEVSRGRNLLERAMRDFVGTILRVECARKEESRSPQDVLVAAIPLERRESMAGKRTSEILKALYWTDLLAVIKKSWPWFQRYFGDRSSVDLWGGIVNDRPDAHAKEVDGADLALQRRAIQWFQDAIDRSGVL